MVRLVRGTMRIVDPGHGRLVVDVVEGISIPEREESPVGKGG